MTKRYIALGDGRTIGLGKYVAAWKRCKELPPDTWIGKGISGWGETAGEALAKVRAGMHDRINRNIPGYGVGRKWSSDWFAEMKRLSYDLNRPRLLIDWLPPDLMKVPRFADRVAYAAEVRRDGY